MRTRLCCATSAMKSTSRPRSIGHGSTSVRTPRSWSSARRSMQRAGVLATGRTIERRLGLPAGPADHQVLVHQRDPEGVRRAADPSPSGRSAWPEQSAERPRPSRCPGRRSLALAGGPSVASPRACVARGSCSPPPSFSSALGVFVVRGAGRFLVVADPLPAHADAIVMLAGSLSDRVARDRPALSCRRRAARRPHPRAPADAGRRRSAPTASALPEEHELARRALGELGRARRAPFAWCRAARRAPRPRRVRIARWVCSSRVPSRRRRDVADAHAARAADPPAGARSPTSR